MPDDSFARHGLGVTYEEVLQKSHATLETGFIPLQPSYEDSGRFQQQQQQQQSQARTNHSNPTITLPGPEYGVVQRTLGPPAMRDAKARRRESSMLFMGIGQIQEGLVQGEKGSQRKSSMPLLRGEHGTGEL